MENPYADKFRNHLENLGYSQTSQQMLPFCVAEFFAFTGGEPCDAQPSDVSAFYGYLKNRPNKRREGGLSPNYINHHIYALRLFFGWLCESGELVNDPMGFLEFPKPQTPDREILSREEIKKLYGLCADGRETAFLALFYGCGLRRSEAVKLDLKDADFKKGILYVREGKGSKRREVPMSGKVAEDLKNYAENMRPRNKETSFYLNTKGCRMLGGSYLALLKKLLERSGIEKNITLHGLRHSIATHLLESGLPVEQVRDFLGHRYLETTQIYTKIKDEQLYGF